MSPIAAGPITRIRIDSGGELIGELQEDVAELAKACDAAGEMQQRVAMTDNRHRKRD